VLYEALLIQHKCGHTQLYLAHKYVQYKPMQDIRKIEFRDSGSNANNKICFEVRAILYAPAFTQKDFHYVHTGPSTKGFTEELQLYTWSTLLLSNTITSIQEG